MFFAAGIALLYAYKHPELSERVRLTIVAIGLVLLVSAPYVGVFAVRALYKRRIRRAQQV